MKLAPVLASALAAVCIASTSTGTSAHVAQLYEEDAGFMPMVGQDLLLTPSLRRRMQTTGSTSTDTPEATTATPTTTAPTPTTSAPSPTTSAPTPTTSAPTATTATPTETPTATTATPEATTETPTSTTATPEATTATPDSTTAAPSSTTATPSATSAPSTTSTTGSTSSTTETTPSATSAAASSSGSAASSSADTSSGSSMSTGAVIGIVVGIVAAVAVVATLIMCAIRRRREAEDDPLSPFELSMDKGYSATPGFTAQNSYNPRATGAAAVGASASGSASMQTPPAGHVAAGVAYSQFYDGAATSPGSMNRLESNVDSVQSDNHNPATNGTNLWLSAMEPKDNDSYLSAHESPNGRSSRNSSRNSYNSSFGVAVDVDQSSQISGHSGKSDDFPDHHKDTDSARGSYEL
ncbi:hypothetical protein PHYBOEH_003636 [Phytophthora boehmeriae]|uniref:Carbohydrate-binding protein n=1 Tax=Phytophthora boehmeriae TaxID=109152 RepID=A0A8T1WNQ6_9STRA|nr:hypothetical protein PHYBOEH_003636 [Phytophthora boehmeriae]